MPRTPAPPAGLEVQGVRDPDDLRVVVYWRYRPVGTRRWLGAVSRRGGRWRALGYDPGAVAVGQLGSYDTRRLAEEAVAAHVAAVAETRQPV